MGNLFDKMFDNDEIRTKIKEIVLEELRTDDDFRSELRRVIFK